MTQPCVLVVDDQAEQRTLLRELLAEYGGYHVIEACNGHEGVALATSASPDVILMDLDMPGLGGLEACRRLKQHPRARLVPLIIVTAWHERDARLAGLRAGCDDFLTKPVDPDELLARVGGALRMKDAIDQLEEAENVIFSLARAIEAKDACTGGHSERVAVLAERLGRATGLSEDKLLHLRRAALLHDVGKIGTPRAVLSKPGPLTADEVAVIQLHPVVGEAICQPLHTLRPVLQLIRGHHERPDGQGYPDGLDAAAMEPTLHCLIVADAYDALTSVRPYRPALDRRAALLLMHTQARAGAWDSVTVERLARVLESET